MITKTTGKYPLESYSTVVFSIQSECMFLACVTKEIGHAFMGVEKILQEDFLRCLVFVKLKSLQSIVGTLSTIPFKKFSIGLQDPVTSSNKKYLSSLRSIRKLI